MKKLTLSLFAIALTTSMLAQGVLTFFSQDGQKFWVVINGERINQEAAFNVKDIPVNFKYGKAVIIFENEKIPQINKNVQVVDVDDNWLHVKYMIRPDKKNRYRIRDIDSAFEIISPSAAAPATTTQPVEQPAPATQTMVISPAPASTTQTTVTQTTTINPGSATTTIYDPITGEAITVSVDVAIPELTTTITETTTTTTASQTISETVPAQPSHYVMPGYNGKIGCPWPMSEGDFADAKKSISSKSFEDSKLTIAKQIASSNCLLCTQVKEVMKIFNFEDSRLEFAKYAFDYVYDIGNYYKLNDAFSFESSIDELNTYISRRR